MRFLLCAMLVACGGRIAGAPQSTSLDAVCDGPGITGQSVVEGITNWPPLPGYSAEQGIRFVDEPTWSALHIEVSPVHDASASCSESDVEVPVDVRMWSAEDVYGTPEDGRLNERFVATISRTGAASDVELRATLATSELGGSLRHELSAPAIELRFTFLRVPGAVELFGTIYAGDAKLADL